MRLVARTGGDRAPLYPEIARGAGAPPARELRDRRRDRGARREGPQLLRAHPAALHARASPRAIARAVRGGAGRLPGLRPARRRSAATCAASPLARRKELLARFVPPLGVVRFTDHVEGDGQRLFAAAAEHGLEGVIAKRADSPLRVGSALEELAEAEGAAQRAARDRRLDGGAGLARATRRAAARRGSATARWCYAGSAGSGLDEATIAALLPRSRRRGCATPPCAACPIRRRAARAGCGPGLVCEVRFTEVTSAGLLRQPVFLGLRAERRVADTAARRATPGRRPWSRPRVRPRRALRRRRPSPSSRSRALEKVFWPVEGYTKGDLLAYYEAVWPWLAPYLKRPPRRADALPGRHRGQELLPEERARLHAGLGARASVSTTPTTSSATTCARSSTWSTRARSRCTCGARGAARSTGPTG